MIAEPVYIARKTVLKFLQSVEAMAVHKLSFDNPER